MIKHSAQQKKAETLLRIPLREEGLGPVAGSERKEKSKFIPREKKEYFQVLCGEKFYFQILFLKK